jgi:HSP20 family protein
MAVRDLMPWRAGRRGGLIRREEDDPFRSLHREMDRLFDDFVHGFELAPWMGERWPTMSRGYAPQIDVTESDTEVIVTAELPGMEEKDIDVSLGHGALTMKGEKREAKESKERGYYRSERSYGSFARTIPLPCEVEEDKVSATFKKGVLTISLPKTPEARREVKHIEVKTD